MYTKKQKIQSVLVCILFVAVTFFTTLFIVKEANHDCTGENCPICASIQQAEQTLNQLGTGTVETASFLTVILSCAAVLSGIFFFVPCASLISQKVRLND